jgi:hypothetical protein
MRPSRFTPLSSLTMQTQSLHAHFTCSIVPLMVALLFRCRDLVVPFSASRYGYDVALVPDAAIGPTTSSQKKICDKTV